MNKRNLHLLLLLISWTALSGQTPGLSRISKDTSRCYDPFELKAIALKLILGNECDTLLKVFKKVVIAKDTMITSQARTITKQDIRYITTKQLVDEKEIQKVIIEKDLKKARRRIKWIKVGWAITTVALTVTTVLALVK